MNFQLAAKRGWAVGAVAAVVYGGFALVTAIDRDGLDAWSRRHPVLGGSLGGPLLFLVVAIWPVPLWICILVGLVGVPVGAAMGARQGRRLSATPPARPSADSPGSTAVTTIGPVAAADMRDRRKRVVMFVILIMTLMAAGVAVGMAAAMLGGAPYEPS